MGKRSDRRLEVNILSEIGPLEHVLVHRPGDEVVHMTQHELEELLFDDILSSDEAMREHDIFREILTGSGAEVVDVFDLLEVAIARSSKATCLELIAEVCDLAGTPELRPILEHFDHKRLARALVCGFRWKDLDASPRTLTRLRKQVFEENDFALAPVPNLMFMRDPAVAIGNHIVIGRMATLARAREPLLVRFALEQSGAVDVSQFVLDDPAVGRQPSYRRLEGGDCLVIGPDVLLVGCSERSSSQTVERVARMLFEELEGLERAYVVLLPSARSLMHLDTIVTHIDDKVFLGHAPLVEGKDALRVARIEPDQAPELLDGSLLDILREELGPDVALVPCGGRDPLHQEREQWTDGANAFAVSPGHIIVYARNVRTTAALNEVGFETVVLHQVQSPEERAERIVQGMQRDRAVFCFSGAELSRARGGGRCLTMPLRRR